MTDQHPITPPPELIEQWVQNHATRYDLARHAAQWGAGQELEACLDWLTDRDWFPVGHEAIDDLRAARRPKPLSLKVQALEILQDLANGIEGTDSWAVIQSALEQLDD